MRVPSFIVKRVKSASGTPDSRPIAIGFAGPPPLRSAAPLNATKIMLPSDPAVRSIVAIGPAVAGGCFR